jgi:hypothetical protein
MAFGFSFGKSGQKSTQNTAIDKTESTSQNKTGTQSTTGTTTNEGTSTQQNTSTGTQTQAQTGTTAQTANTAGQTTQQTNLFSDAILKGLEGTVGGLFSNTSGATVGSFDPTAFVAGGLARASADSTGKLEDSLNQMVAATGGRVDGNSMTALLANRARNDSAAAMAGTEATLNAQANEIVRSNALAGNTIDQSQQGFLTNLLQVLKGGSATTTGAETQSTAQTGTTGTTGTTTTAESGTQTGTTKQVQTQDLMTALTELLSGVTNTTGTENTTGTQSKSGGGFSLAL